MINLLKIDGDSMLPKMADGDFIFISRLYINLQPRHMVVVSHPIYQRIVKRIEHINNDGQLWLCGDNRLSLSSAQMGWIEPSWITGKVLIIINKRS